MSALAALIAIATPAQAAPAPSPLFDAFKAACANVGTFDGVGTAALAAGWSEAAETQADPRIVAIIAKGRDAMKREEPGAAIAGQLFRHKFDGRDVWLATSRVTFKMGGKDAWANGCRAYDLDAPAAPTAQMATAWVGKAPTGSQDSGNAAKMLWDPWQDGVSLEISYVPRDNPLGTKFGIQGLVLVSQAIGGF